MSHHPGLRRQGRGGRHGRSAGDLSGSSSIPGANESTISPKLATALGLALSTSRPLRIAGVTGTEIVPSVPVDTLRAGALVIAHSQLPVIWSPIMTGADGILGAAGLAQDSLLVDFLHNTVVIHTAEDVGIPSGYARVQATRLRGGLLSVPGEVGNVPVDAIIDTGSPQTLGNMALYRALYSKVEAGGHANVLRRHQASAPRQCASGAHGRPRGDPHRQRRAGLRRFPRSSRCGD